jgi:hypothetical protein
VYAAQPIADKSPSHAEAGSPASASLARLCGHVISIALLAITTHHPSNWSPPAITPYRHLHSQRQHPELTPFNMGVKGLWSLLSPVARPIK